MKQKIFSDVALRAAAREIVMYKANDEGLAMFRVKASRILNEITLCGAEGGEPTAEHLDFIAPWLTDRNDMFRKFFTELNRVLEREYIKF